MKGLIGIKHDDYIIVKVVPDSNLVSEVTVPIVTCVRLCVLFPEYGTLLGVSSLCADCWVGPSLAHSVGSAEYYVPISLGAEDEIAPASQSMAVLPTGDNAGAPNPGGSAQCPAWLPSGLERYRRGGCAENG